MPDHRRGNSLLSVRASHVEAHAPVAPAASLPFRADIQGLRAIAVIAVVVYHAGGLVPGGFLGVDVFFVISGFVITGLIARRWQNGSFRLSDFALARFRRLAPALALVTVVTLVVSPLFTSPFVAQENLALTALGSTFWVANVVISSTTGDYFDAPALTNPLLQMWSLSVEEQLYLLFAILAVILIRISSGTYQKRKWVIAIVVLSVISLVITILQPFSTDSGWANFLFGFYGPLGRVWEFGVGALIALGANRVRMSRGVATAAGGIGLVLVLGAFTLTPATAIVPGSGSLAPVLGTGLLLLAGSHRNPVGTLLSTRGFTFLGDRSYSIYLWHWPVIVWVATFAESTIALALAALASFVPAFLSYTFIENPIRHRRQWQGRHVSALVGICIGVPTITALGVLVISRQKYFNPELRTLDNVLSQPHLSNFLQCYEEPLFQGPTGRCSINPELQGRPIYLIGDSNADHLSEAVVGAGEQLGRPVSIAYKNNCSVLQAETLAQDPGSCMSFVSQVFSHLQGKPPGTVVLSITDTYGFGGNGELEPLVQDLRRFIQDMEDRGHSVVLVRSVPKWGGRYEFNPTGLTLLEFINGDWKVEAPASDLAATGAPLWTAYQAATADGSATIYDPWPILCPDGLCSTFNNGQLTYSDGVHITVAQSAALAESLSTSLQEEPGAGSP